MLIGGFGLLPYSDISGWYLIQIGRLQIQIQLNYFQGICRCNFLRFVVLSLTNINFIYMMASKLEELKRKMLMASQLKKQNQESIPQPRPSEDPPQQAEHQPQSSAENKSKQLEQVQDANDSLDESNSDEGPQEKSLPVEQQPRNNGNFELGHQDENNQGLVEEDGQIKDGIVKHNVEGKAFNHEQAQERAVQNHQNLDLSKDQNAFMSVDEQVRQIMTEKINEIQKQMEPEESKVEKKFNKIVIKELQKVKQCIKNLQSAVIGLEYVQERVKYYPSLKEKLRKQIKYLKALSQQ